MKIIKDLGTNYRASSSKKERWCLAECINCKVQKELQTSQVKRNPTALCQTCSAKQVAEQNRLKAAKKFIDKAKKVHKTLFDYTETTYVTNQEKVSIHCNTCNVTFNQRPAEHKRGAGCPNCKVKGGWSYTAWENAGKGKDGYKVYMVECWNENEHFIKIGKTFNKISRRFSGANNMPYNWKLIATVEGSPKYICMLEQKLHNACKNFKYLPKTHFHGRHECYINEINKLREIFYDSTRIQK